MKYKIKQFKRAILTIITVVFTIMSMTTHAQDIHITQNTTWSTNQNPTGNVFIENGATLTIAAGVTVTMPSYGYIIVREECKLIASDVTFTGPANWFGIYAHGYGNSIDQVQLLNSGGEKQPEIDLIDCQLSGMLYGINNADPINGNPNSNSGGILKILRCEFDNCSMGVRFYKYIHIRQNNNVARELSYIYNSKFIVYNSPIVPPIGIYMNGIVNLKIYGCHFYSHSYILIGVEADLATFTIDDYYTGLPFNPVFVSPSEFRCCKYGVKTNNSNALMGKCLIRNSDFIADLTSIYALNSDNIEIYSNNIQISGFNPQVGIYLENCVTFHVENNDLSTWANAPTSPDTYGIVAHDCGENNNRIYNNNVTNFEYNIVGQNHNRGIVNQSGLQFICNNLYQTGPIGTDNTYYMACLIDPPIQNTNPLYGINDWQTGGAYNTSTNQFEPNSSVYNEIPNRALPSGSKYDFLNEHIRLGQDIFYKDPKNNTLPLKQLDDDGDPTTIDFYGNYIWVTDENSLYNFPNTCPSTVPINFPTPTTLSNISAQLQSVLIPYGPLKATFAGYENNGDYQFMLDQVNNMNNTNYTIVYYYLMNNHPSTDVIAIAVGNDVLPDYMCEDVLTTNSYGIKSQLVRDALAGRQNQLTSTQMDNINIAAQTQSQYESYLLELATLRTQINSLSTEKYNYYFDVYDDEVEINKVITTLSDNQNFYSYVSLMMYYFENGNISLAVDNYQMAMNADETSDLETTNLDQLFNVLMIVYNQLGGNFSQLDPAEINNLEIISETDSKSGGIAKCILISEFEYKYEPILLKASQGGARIAKPNGKNIINQTNKMQINPNPAESINGITITGSFKYPLQLNIYDLSGKLVLHKQIDNLKTIQIENLTSGFYQTKIIDANQRVFNKKLIIK